MTIYSHHPSRGKIQILATYRGSGGVVSSTVTSVDDARLAVPIVDALNRISACAAVPVSVSDERRTPPGFYPRGHLAALTDRNARAGLLEGAHSLWYVYAMWLLHRALIDLDDATAVVPAPVRTAITAELEVEARELREAVAEFFEGIEAPETEERIWDFGSPFVAFDGGVEGLGEMDRLGLNNIERGITTEQVSKAVTDLRLLLDAYARCANHEARLIVDDFMITDDPLEDDPEDLFLNVQAPIPGGLYGRGDWRVVLYRWIRDAPGDEENVDITGVPILRCARSDAPTTNEIVELLNSSGARAKQLAAWTKTPVGEVLDGTAFVVTKRY